MRFKKGIKVEVLSKREVPSGSWFPAEIVSRNGCYYNVEYDYYLPDAGRAIEKVQRMSIRLCPPPTEGLRTCVPGDIVEVFDHNSWKIAKMIKVLDGGNYYVVALIGSSRGIKLHKSNIRLRLSWKNNTWVLVDKGPEKFSEGKTDISSAVKYSHKKVKQNAEVKNCKGDEHCQISLRSLKKRPCLSPSGVEMCARAGAGRKMGAVNKEGKRQRLLVAHSSDVPEKVDICASTRIIPGARYTDASLNNNRSAGFHELGVNWNFGIPNDDVVHFVLGSLEHSGSDSRASSTGSCSPRSNPYRSPDHPNGNPTQNVAANFDVVEVSSGSGSEHCIPTRERVTAGIHQLELNAYRSTMVALHASGPLSWEREALLTNLRLMLNITNDEHLSELRHLNKYQK